LPQRGWNAEIITTLDKKTEGNSLFFSELARIPALFFAGVG